MMFLPFTPAYLLDLSPRQVTLRNLRTGQQLQEPPELAVAWVPAPPRIFAIGHQAQEAVLAYQHKHPGADARVVNPFAHPRSLVSDLTMAEQLFKALLCRAQAGRLALAPALLMRLDGPDEGGYTDAERQALMGVARAAGAGVVVFQDIHAACTDEQRLAVLGGQTIA